VPRVAQFAVDSWPFRGGLGGGNKIAS